MNRIKIQPELDLEIIGDWFIVKEGNNGKIFNKFSTPNMEEVMLFAELYAWGEFGDRETFEGYIMWLMEIQQVLKEAQHGRTSLI